MCSSATWPRGRRSGEPPRRRRQSRNRSRLPSISADGRYVTYSRWLYVRALGWSAWVKLIVNRETGNTHVLARTTDGRPAVAGGATAPLSADGSRVAFGAGDVNLLSTDGHRDSGIFVWDRP